jgi:hypothetical protein
MADGRGERRGRRESKVRCSGRVDMSGAAQMETKR